MNPTSFTGKMLPSGLLVEIDRLDLDAGGRLGGHGDFIAPGECAKELLAISLAPDIGQIHVDDAFCAQVIPRWRLYSRQSCRAG